MNLGELRAALSMITNLPDSALVIIDVEDTAYVHLRSVSHDEDLESLDDGAVPCVWLNGDMDDPVP